MKIDDFLYRKVIGQESKNFIKGHTLRPDLVLVNKKTKDKIVIDTKWKLGNQYISVQDLRQVYTYGRYWNAKKVMLLYPGKTNNNKFEIFNNPNDSIVHQCKTGFVSVLNSKGNLDENLGIKIINLLELN